MFCKKCGAQLSSETVRFCQACGCPVTQQQDANNGTFDFGQVKRESFRHDLSGVWPEWQIEKQYTIFVCFVKITPAQAWSAAYVPKHNRKYRENIFV